MRGLALEAHTRSCRMCRRVFQTHHNQQVNCSHECMVAHARELRRARRRNAVESLTADCPACGKRFAQDRLKARMYCSSACTKRAWKIRHRERHLAAAIAFQNKKKLGGNYLRALERDEGKCCQCGTPSVLVHHLDNRGEKCTIISQNHALDNLKTLCPPCHRALHRLDWAFDGEALVISSEAFKAFLGTATIRVPAKVVMPYDA